MPSGAGPAAIFIAAESRRPPLPPPGDAGQLELRLQLSTQHPSPLKEDSVSRRCHVAGKPSSSLPSTGHCSLLALARKYRPKNFADVAVQSHVSNTLQGRDRPRARGARLPAVRAARGGQDDARARAGHGAQLRAAQRRRRRAVRRVRELHAHLERRRLASTSSRSTRPPTAAWTTRASCASARCTRRPASDRYKVYIVDEAHMLTREAWNALLKILEEPPPRVVFVFATTEPQKIAQAAAPVLSAACSASTSSASGRPTSASALASGARRGGGRRPSPTRWR